MGLGHGRLSEVTAVILSASPLRKKIEGVDVLNHVSRFGDAEGLLRERLRSIEKVQTPWFFVLDDTDELPRDYLGLLDRCMQANVPVAYTNELMAGKLIRSAEYSQEAHLDNPILIHHLAVCKTEAALRAAEVIPRGCYAAEPLLYFQMAKEGAKWFDEVGYIWNKKPGGLSEHPTLSRGINAANAWAYRHRD